MDVAADALCELSFIASVVNTAAQVDRRFVMGRADLRAYYRARVAGMSDFRKKLRTVRPDALATSGEKRLYHRFGCRALEVPSSSLNL